MLHFSTLCMIPATMSTLEAFPVPFSTIMISINGVNWMIPVIPAYL
jgi:hypothetical protein